MRIQDHHGGWLFKFVSIFIAVVFVLVILCWVGAGVLVYFSVDAIGEHGVRGVIEQIWCGQTPDCKLPSVDK